MNNPPPPRRTTSAQWIEREKFVEAFEAARAADPAVDLAPFLPPPDHPLHVPVLEELVRIDLEQHWLGGTPRWLEEYFRRFPQLMEASASIRTLAFEEFRLRRQAGEAPTADEYQRRFGIDLKRALRDDQLELMPGPRPRPPRTDRFAQVLAALPQVGDRFLHYRLLAELGAGAYGRAFLAERAGRRVAVKVGPAVGTEPLVRLRHRNIVAVETVHHVGSFRAVVMPYLGGVTLAHVLQSVAELPDRPTRGEVLFAAGRPDLPDSKPSASDTALRRTLAEMSYSDVVLWLAAQIADGLAHAHARGILHRDLKPANVLYTPAGRPMLLDFHPAGTNHRDPVGGTLPYMAPEQIAVFRGCGRVVDGRADLFALGVIVYQFFAGRLPFTAVPDDSGRGWEEVVAERERAIPELVAASGDIPPAAAAFVGRLLAPNPSDRYATAAVAASEVRRILRHNRPPMRRVPGWLRRLLQHLRR